MKNWCTRKGDSYINLLTVRRFIYGKCAVTHDFLVNMYNSILGINDFFADSVIYVKHDCKCQLLVNIRKTNLNENKMYYDAKVTTMW